MAHKHCFARRSRRQILLLSVVSLLLLSLVVFHLVAPNAWALLSLPLVWKRKSAQSIISPEKDGFDITFETYGIHNTSSGSISGDRVPPIIHHILLGPSSEPTGQWKDARQTCLDFHPGWETHLWTEDKSNQFVAERFPELLETWKGYHHRVQRVDALRYMALYEYGGKQKSLAHNDLFFFSVVRPPLLI